MISKGTIYCVNFLDNSFAKKNKKLPKEILIGLNILNKSYIYNIYPFKFVNTYDVICSSFYNIFSMKE